MKAIQVALEQYKLVHLVGFDFQLPIHEFFTLLSDSLGWVIDMDEDKKTGKKTGERWIDISYDPAQPNKYRSSNTRQPLHTDNSYLNHHDAVNYFYCVSQAKLGGATIFLDSDLLVKALEIDQEYQLLEDLRSISICFSRHNHHKTKPIITEDELGYRLNYNYYRLDPEDTPEAKNLVEKFQNFLETRIHNSQITTNILLNPGDAVFFNDERLLHGRTAFFTTDKGERTLIKGSVVLYSRKHKNLHLEQISQDESVN
ncbi:TauD/TfdA family dioxygenase [Moorena sp. SIO4A5]|uniref:TauD/TfdA family dioxygenase n=1 Tax=Moorena sp. SIO4A5 TaxID=2607838 RepID=UPI0013C6A068|nr:TauD/TfdA family dioxygenase [Moorena sp. SIO4A5]NEO21424.1 TauD/TfdA family dioxygenase [Moorena sp. SIO4A5]